MILTHGIVIVNIVNILYTASHVTSLRRPSASCMRELVRSVKDAEIIQRAAERGTHVVGFQGETQGCSEITACQLLIEK